MQTFMYTPQSYQKAPIFTNHAKVHRPFSNSPTGKWHPPNLQQIAQNPLNLHTSGMNLAKFAQSAQISQGIPPYQCHLCINPNVFHSPIGKRYHNNIQ